MFIDRLTDRQTVLYTLMVKYYWAIKEWTIDIQQHEWTWNDYAEWRTPDQIHTHTHTHTHISMLGWLNLSCLYGCLIRGWINNRENECFGHSDKHEIKVRKKWKWGKNSSFSPITEAIMYQLLNNSRLKGKNKKVKLSLRKATISMHCCFLNDYLKMVPCWGFVNEMMFVWIKLFDGVKKMKWNNFFKIFK